MNFPSKNSLPWTGIYKLPITVNQEYINELKIIFQSEDWGDSYEKNKRILSQSAIYSSTRTIFYSPYNQWSNSNNQNLIRLCHLISNDLKKAFTIDMSMQWAELVLLVPFGQIPWHHDRMEICSIASRIMLPFTDNCEDITYYFQSWADNTPRDTADFYTVKYLKGDVQEYKMYPGNFYMFNHRVPHKTISRSKSPRGLITIEMVPSEYVQYNWSADYGKIKDHEMIPIIPNVE